MKAQEGAQRIGKGSHTRSCGGGGGTGLRDLTDHLVTAYGRRAVLGYWLGGSGAAQVLNPLGHAVGDRGYRHRDENLKEVKGAGVHVVDDLIEDGGQGRGHEDLSESSCRARDNREG